MLCWLRHDIMEISFCLKEGAPVPAGIAPLREKLGYHMDHPLAALVIVIGALRHVDCLADLLLC